MEEDVHFTDVSQLEQLLHNANGTSYDASADLLLQSRPVLAKGKWFHTSWTKKQIADRNGWGRDYWEENPQYHIMMNLFRTSSLFLTKLEEDFRSNENTWGFFETYFIALANLHNLIMSDWKSKKLRFRPCWTEFPTPGIYHPAKWKNNRFIECFKKLRRE